MFRVGKWARDNLFDIKHEFKNMIRVGVRVNRCVRVSTWLGKRF